MFWSEDSEDKNRFVVPDDVLEFVYSVKECKCLPVEHAYALSEALHQALPWLADEEHAGIHQISGAESGNGWIRPDNPDELIFLSRRQKMTLRLPKARMEEASKLTGQTLNIGGNRLTVGEMTTKPLSDLSTVFARGVVSEEGMDENEFMAHVVEELKKMDVQLKKMMCGIERVIRTPDGPLHTRGLMLAELLPEDSVKLQQYGVGPGRKLGCGLFLPQKDIKAVNPK